MSKEPNSPTSFKHIRKKEGTNSKQCKRRGRQQEVPKDSTKEIKFSRTSTQTVIEAFSKVVKEISDNSCAVMSVEGMKNETDSELEGSEESG